MKFIEVELQQALHGRVRRKANCTAALRGTAARVARHAPEVMVKITGFGKGGAHVKAHLDYITRQGQLEIENERGERVIGKEAVKAFFAEWAQDFNDGKRHARQRDTMHMVLSMPPSVDPVSVRAAVRAFSRESFGKNHLYAFALHTDADHPHCHLTVQCLGFDGTRLNPRKADLQQWREGFAARLGDQGIDAVATPRRSRGVIRKAERSVIRHIERGDDTHPPRVSRVRAAKIREAARDLSAATNGTWTQAAPWEAAIRSQRTNVRQAWLAAADALESEADRPSFIWKETCHGRPDYAHRTTDDIQRRQCAAALHQSDLGQPTRALASGSLAGMRNLSSLGLVCDRNTIEMLLRTHARDRLGWHRSAGDALRREGAGLARAESQPERTLNKEGDVLSADRQLARRIREFVAAMPDLVTERQATTRLLHDLFSRPVPQKSLSTQKIKTAVVSEQTKAITPPHSRDKGLDR